MFGSPALVATLMVVGVLIAAAVITVGIVVLRRSDKRRFAVPATLLSRGHALGGETVTVAYPGPGGQPLQADVFAVHRRGLGATPTFSGWVYVNPANPADVTTRPQGRTGPGWALIIVGVVLLVLAAVGGGTILAIAGLASLGEPTMAP